MAFTQQGAYLRLTTDLGADALLLRQLDGVEAISEPFRFEIEAQSEDRALDLSALPGTAAAVTVDLADGSQRWLHGIVGRFLHVGGDARLARYRLELHPWLWLLTLSADCRIFQGKSVPEILEEVFLDHGWSDFDNRLSATYPPREYCVQYGETAFDFVSRLMEEEGIAYWFEHTADRHTLVLADDPGAFTACPGADRVGYGESGTWLQQNVVTDCAAEHNVVIGSYYVDDFNFETPSTDLMVFARGDSAGGGAGSGEAAGRVYEYPGGFATSDDGEARASLRLEERELPARRLTGTSFCRAFTAGRKTRLAEHPRNDVNGEWVLHRVHHHGGEESYGNRFEAFPAGVPFRPPRRTPRPRIASTQTAIVVGKAGEEIWTDRFGRVKVQFHWDQRGGYDENSSCWVRVAHGWAGQGWGMIAVPRIGQEVVVSFLDGDPDRPLITGSVYNAEQAVPYALPANGTRSTWKSNSSKDGAGGYNELRFEDAKDSEEVYLHAQKDETLVIENDKSETVGNDESISIGNDRSETVGHDQRITIENDRSETVQHDETLTVDNDRSRQVGGKETVRVDKEQSLSVGKDREVTVSDNEERSVGKDQTLTIGGDRTGDVTGKDTLAVGKAYAVNAGDSILLQTGSAKLEMKSDGTITLSGKDVTLKGSGKITVQATQDLVLKGMSVKAN